MSFNDVLTVSQLTAQIKNLIESNYASIVVRGEISNFTHHSSGHMYFTLKDSHSELRAVMFKGSNNGLTFSPKNGLDVIAKGKLSVYEARGQYQIILNHMEPAGIGALYQAFEETKKRLQAEGMFSDERKLSLPKFPTSVGIVTSKTGAALQDMLIIFKRRAPQVKIVIRSALVQGDDAALDVASGIADLSTIDDIDLIIIGRGGGSFEDLWPFNDEALAREIVKCKKPIISAVGHETDLTISDMVADLRAPTPSAAAEIAIKNIFEISQNIDDQTKRIQNIVESKIASYWQTLDNLVERHNLQKPINVFKRHLEKIENFDKNLKIIMNKIFLLKESKLQSLSNSLEALSPNNTLKRGYSIAFNKKNQIITHPESIASNESFKVKMADGEMAAVKK
ncbi:MAG: exodeoxyribonuclease VII large subunit [Candidatus Neomarinimicrobiota bacterium]|mgnify:FL=1|nr:exodeoxyribonuclease VII large subunit [Candidatus Neomarinimicrobiota bacterium]|tara:strand:- start:9719 stop:10906 length:1188 start_codon:yes stop_codon:yes gene_type:complete